MRPPLFSPIWGGGPKPVGVRYLRQDWYGASSQLFENCINYLVPQDQYTLNRHVDLVHQLKTQVFKCIPCNKEFNRKDMLLAHQKRPTCLQNCSFFCDKCAKGFVNEEKLKLHKKKCKTKEQVPVIQI